MAKHIRLIDADALKEYFFRPYSNEESYSNIDVGRIIDKQPEIKSKQKTDKWIPCSEKLPEKFQTVLITHRGGVSTGWYNGRYWEHGASTKHREIKTVKAWMQLPSAYIEERR